MSAVILDHPAAPEQAQHVEVLVETLAARAEVDTVDVELLLHPADARAEDEAVAAQDRERARGARHLERIAQRQHVDGDRETQALRVTAAIAPMLAQQSGYQSSACIGGLPSGE